MIKLHTVTCCLNDAGLETGGYDLKNGAVSDCLRRRSAAMRWSASLAICDGRALGLNDAALSSRVSCCRCRRHSLAVCAGAHGSTPSRSCARRRQGMSQPRQQRLDRIALSFRRGSGASPQRNGPLAVRPQPTSADRRAPSEARLCAPSVAF
jgi:hypothetical protein